MKHTVTLTVELPTFKSLDTEPIDPVYLIKQHATPAHCANIARIARDYGWDPRLFPILMATGTTREDCDVIAASICQGRRRFCEEYAHLVLPNCPPFDSAALMAYRIQADPSGQLPAEPISPAQIENIALREENKELKLRLAENATALEESRKMVHFLQNLQSQSPQPDTAPNNKNNAKPKDKKMDQPTTEADGDALSAADTLEQEQAKALEDRRRKLATFFSKEEDCLDFERKISEVDNVFDLLNLVVKSFCDEGRLPYKNIKTMTLAKYMHPFLQLTKPIEIGSLQKRLRTFFQEYHQ